MSDSGTTTHALGSPCTSVPDVDRDDCASCQSLSGHVTKKAKGRSKSKSIHPAHGEENNNVRLRNSCRSCANSKVKCDKGKPTCSRCQTRSLDCAYLQSKRPGRVPGRGQASQLADLFSAEDTQLAKSMNDYGATANFPSAVDFGLEGYGADFSRQRTDSGFSVPSTGNIDFNVFGTPTSEGTSTDIFCAGNAPTAPMGSSGEVSSLEDMVSSDWMMSELNLADLNSWWTDSVNDFSNDSLSHTTSNYTSLSGSTEQSSLAPSSSSSTVHFRDLLEPTAVSQSSGQERKQLPSPVQSHLFGPGIATTNCACMSQALDLLKTLSSTDQPELLPVSVDSYTQRVLLQNQQDIDVNLAILECRACSNDRYLLMILLMIAAKILARYVSAAASCGSRDHGSEPSTAMQGEEETTVVSEHADRLMEMSRTWGGFCMMLPATRGNGAAQSPSREAVQRVLRQLHRVQKLISHLAIRRKSLGGHATATYCVADPRESSRIDLDGKSNNSQIGSKRPLPSDSTPGPTTAIPLPFIALESVEADIRHGLSGLSAVMRSLLSNS
ncbi:hypothetical protein LTR56_013052 [Elasticomyces elasticus]|nr:hypothetical protein LTR22_026156 [Elasticomyces elasticus]KAK3638412.1 hypothetical protein LTR56_013052 [Elasticomyces elasticus]KAK4920508.1 hypothetical protein LTR49_011923 [Elasticomyces elasticus]KAK5758991.1 hypothetical protein LTS12_010932 [Elasticomyces elasticus]